MTAHKNSRNTIAARRQNMAVFFCLLLMMVCLYVSRAALSVSVILFVVMAMANRDLLAPLRKLITTPVLLGLSFLFFIPFISGLWSDDLDKWQDVIRIKLPLFFLPLAFAGKWKLSEKHWLQVAAVFLSVVLGGCVWGLIDYAQNTATIHEGYLRAKTILTPLEDDHVRFSWLVSVAVILCLFLLQGYLSKAWKVVLLLLVVFFISYLYILSARTGLLSLYISLLLFAAWLFLKERKKKSSIFFVLLLVTLPVLAYFVLPTFKARIQYNFYDLSFAQKQQYLPGSSDGARTMSLKAGWQVLEQNPFGVGAGDVMTEADKWYTVHLPEVLPADKFYPSSEWLMHGAFAGWPGVILFSGIMAMPLFSRPKRGAIFWMAFHITAAFSFVFDMGLEVQYGVFLYAFVSGWLWKWLNVSGRPPMAHERVL